MSAVSRDWATPVTVAVFVLMAGTGLLMFYHAERGLQKDVHEWLGWGMVAAVALHVLANWPMARRYLTWTNSGSWALVGSVALLALSFAIVPGGAAEGASPPALAIRALTQAPLASVAPLTGKPLAQLMTELAAAGVPVNDGGQTLAAATRGDREQVGKALRVMFQAPAAAR